MEDHQMVELNEEELQCLRATADGVRLAAKIVDMPCSEMNVHHFVKVSVLFGLLKALFKIVLLVRDEVELQSEIMPFFFF